MARKVGPMTIIIREAIAAVLARSTEPLTTGEICEAPEVASLQVDSGVVSVVTANMYDRKNQEFSINRIPCSRGKHKWEYFDPNVVKLGFKEKAAPAQEAVNQVNHEPPTFEFNPVDFVPDTPDVAPSPKADVILPAGIKSLTLSVGGVTISMEFQV